MRSSNFYYYHLGMKLTRPMLATVASNPSIWDEHVIQKNKKLIKEANSLTKRMSRLQERHRGDEIPAEKEVLELKSIIRQLQGITGNTSQLPESREELLEFFESLNEDFKDELSTATGSGSPTIFFKDDNGHPMISTHMLLGNFKENLRIIVNNSITDKKVVKSKVAVGECMALDVKPVEDTVLADRDIKRNEDGTPFIFERAITFENMGKKQSAIARSEVLPEETEFWMHLRVRKDSVVTKETLDLLLDMGKSNGLGRWRGSGGMGQYVYKIELDENYQEPWSEKVNYQGWS